MPDDGFAQIWLDAMDGYNKFTPLETPLVVTFLEHKIAIKLAINTIRELDVENEKKTVFNIQSTLKTVLGEHGCGGRI